jgi:hypothetical protein
VPFTVAYKDFCETDSLDLLNNFVTTVLVPASPQAITKQTTCGTQTYSLVQVSKPASSTADPNISFDSVAMKINVSPTSNLSVGAYTYTFTVYDSLKLPRNTEAKMFGVTINPCVITSYTLNIIGNTSYTILGTAKTLTYTVT